MRWKAWGKAHCSINFKTTLTIAISPYVPMKPLFRWMFAYCIVVPPLSSITPFTYLKYNVHWIAPCTSHHVANIMWKNKNLNTPLSVYVHTYIRTYVLTYVLTYIRTYIHTYIHTYVRTYVHTHIHTYVRTYILLCICVYRSLEIIQC